ncbi:MAG: extracellular solute-binding protein [Dechloromonas sp.]|nr:extracellular solute-binding protein [Dechloromonas sp.]
MALACSVVQAKPAKPPKPAPAPAASAEFELAHNLGETGEERLQAIVDRFNKESGSTLKLVRLEKGDKPAALNLMRRYDMSDVLSQPKNFVPLHDMMAKAGQPLSLGELSGDLKAGVVDAKGRLVALPVLYSTPVLFYNKNAFRKAKLNPDQPPKTWFEMQGMLDKLQDAGYACPYTSSWPVWVHVDNVSAVSGVPAATEKGLLTFNGLPQVKHLAMMATWSKANYFKLFGRRNEASARFNEGECAMITTDSREHVDFRDAKGVELGVAPLPYHDDVYGGRQSSLADGASLWVGAGRTPAQYKQAAKFVSFMLSPEMQIEMVRVYGGLPLTAAARSGVRSKLLQDGDRALEVAYASLNGNGNKPAVRVANIDAVRIIANEELEAVWADKKPAKAALDTSVSRGNALLAAKPLLKKSQPF